MHVWVFRNVGHICPQIINCQTKERCVFPEIMTWLLRIIYRPSCEQFHTEAIFFLMVEILVVMMGQVLFHGILFG